MQMGLNELRDKFSDEISEMAKDLTNSLPMSTPQLREAFSDEELQDLHKMVEEVNKATDTNEKIAKIAGNAKTALGLLKKLGVGL
jgi:type 1 glutamine amidotransferase